MIEFPGDAQRGYPSTQSYGAYVNTGGAERFNMINANKITVYDIDASTASIKDASITTAKIGDLQVSTAKIASAAVTNAKIGDLAVTNAKIANATIEYSKIKSLNADHIATGTLTVGGDGATAIAIKHTGSKGDAIVRWEGGSGIWEDTNNYLGQWAYGGQMYFWCGGDDDPRLTLVTGANQNSMYGGLYIHKVDGNGGNLNAEGDFRIGGSYVRIDTDSTPASAGADGDKGMIKWDSNYVYVCVATNTWKRAAISTW